MKYNITHKEIIPLISKKIGGGMGCMPLDEKDKNFENKIDIHNIDLSCELNRYIFRFFLV